MVYTGTTNQEENTMAKQTLSFNVSPAMGAVSSYPTDAARGAVVALHEAGCEVGLHTARPLAGGIYSVRISFDASAAHGPRVIRAMQAIRRLPNVDAVNTI